MGRGIFSICLMALFAVCNGYDKVGRVIAVEGDLTARNLDQKERTLTQNGDVYVGDLLTTGESTRGQIRFYDGTLLLLIPSTQFSVDAYSSGMGKNRFASKLYQGGMRMATGLIAKKNPENFEVGTPNANIGVRGTLFETRLMNKDLYVGSSSGNVSVTNREGTLEIGPSSASQFASIPSIDSAPQPLGSRPEALDLANFELPAGAIPFETVPLASGTAAMAGTSQGYAWGTGLMSLAAVGTVVGVVVTAATQSQSSFAHSH